MKKQRLNGAIVILLIVWMEASVSRASLLNNTWNDQHNCACKDCSEKTVNIECVGRFTVREVQGIINRITYTGSETFDFSLKLQTSSAIIPANFLGGKRASRISLHCSGPTPTKLQIDLNAFRTSSFHTDTFRIFNCDLQQQADFLFLSDFERLYSLSIQNSLNVASFYNLPPLVSLRQVVIYNSTGLVGLQRFPSNALAAGLKDFDLALNFLGDEQISNILNSLVTSSTARTLEVLRLSSNKLNHIPPSTLLSSFVRLNQLFLDGNNISSIGRNSLAFAATLPNLSLISLMDAGVNHIEPGSLDSVRAKIHLDVNHLSHLRKSVFKPMLDQNSRSGRGGLTITSNLLECSDCGMAWLVRDSRNLLEHVQGNCVLHDKNHTNVLGFEELSATNYANCTSDGESNDDRPPSTTWFYIIVLKILGIN